MTALQVQTIGHLLSNYKSDLIYLANFHRYRNGKISNEDYIKKTNGSFYKFLIEFKVIRNIKKDRVSEVLSMTKDWITASESDNVDKFALNLQKFELTHDNKIMTSLASKILFLNNPYKIFPIDSRARKSLLYRANNYADFLTLVDAFSRNNKFEIKECLENLNPLCEIIEKEFIKDLKKLPVIRKNRLIDKLLWIGIESKEKTKPFFTS